MPLPARPVRFGLFEVDRASGELRKDGLKVKLQGQPVEVLTALLEHPGEVVTREELRQRLWPSDTFVDFEHNLNSAVKRLREALGDSADTPRFIETLPRHGYRFTGTVNDPPQTPLRTQARSRTLWVAAITVLTIAVVMVALNISTLRNRVSDQISAAPMRSLAVLSLENLSGKPEEEYFADGMTEELTTELGRFRNLRVISRQSVLRYKGTNKPLTQIADELHVDAVVQGSTLRDGNRVRITAQLIRAVPEEHLWAQTYERDLPDVLALQRDVAIAIVENIRIKITPEERAQIVKPHAVNPLALDAYLKGEQEFGRDKHTASQYFQQAVALDPDYALAYAELASSQWSAAYFYSSVPPTSAFSKAEAAAIKSIELDEGLAEGHVVLALVRATYRWDWSGAELEFKRALQLNPSSAAAHRRYGWFLAWMGRYSEAILEAQRGLELDPLSLNSGRVMGAILYCNRQYDQALQQWNHSLELYPNDALVITDIGRAYVEKGLYREAILQFEKARGLTQGETGATATGGGWLGHAYALADRKSDASKILHDLIARSRRSYVSPMNIAMIYVGLGDKDEAFHWLEKAYEQRDGDMVLLNVSPIWDPIRSEPRFADLVRRMNFPQ